MAARDVLLDPPLLRLGVANGWTSVADVVRLAETGELLGLSDAGVVDLVLAADDGQEAVLAAMDALTLARLAATPDTRRGPATPCGGGRCSCATRC